MAMKQAFSSRYWPRFLWLLVLLLVIGLAFWWRGGDLPWVDEQEISEDLKKLERLSVKPSAQELADLNACVSCVNLFSDSLFRTKDHYLAWLDDPVRGPAENQALVEGILPIPDAKPCLQVKPRGTLVGFADYQESLGRVLSLLRTLYEYYQKGAYHQDGFALGRNLHGPLLLAFRDFEEADLQLRHELFPVLQSTRAALWQQGPKLLRQPTLYHLRRFILLAESGVGDGLAPPLPALQDLRLTLDSLTQSVAQGRIRDRRTPKLPDFLLNADKFVQSAEQYLDRQDARIPFTKSEQMLIQRGGEYLVEGSLAAFFVAYRGLAHSYASLGYEAETLYLLVPVLHQRKEKVPFP